MINVIVHLDKLGNIVKVIKVSRVGKMIDVVQKFPGFKWMFPGSRVVRLVVADIYEEYYK